MSALIAHIKELNAESAAWVAEDPANRCAGMLSEDESYWHAMGIYCVPQYEHHEAVTTHYDRYKEVHGIRPRWVDYHLMSTDAIWGLVEDLNREQEREAEEQRIEEEAIEATRREQESLTYNPFANLSL